ncbi:uncharacterized protein LOC123870593 isoform X2 [Maniola jurtina]|nr:uncharacterized protein LOC123870593 isoform X2 [Maniola jurtina]
MVPESEVNTQIIEEGPRICPLCSSEIRLFFINYHEKLLMCENTECEFPFGCEDLKFVRYDNVDDECDIVSEPSQSGQSLLSSDFSTSGWSDIDKYIRICNSEKGPGELNKFEVSSKELKNKKNKNKFSIIEKEKQMQKNIKDLKSLSMELSDMSKSRVTITNKKWINNLMHLQDRSGLKLLEPLENKKCIKKEVKNELKIDIEPGSSGSASAIKIEIAKQSECESQNG